MDAVIKTIKILLVLLATAFDSYILYFSLFDDVSIEKIPTKDG